MSHRINGRIRKINSNFTGGHYAIQSNKSSKPFTNPMGACKSIKLYPDDIVVDIGAFVGEYSLFASRFVKRVVSYEASPDTFKVLKMNYRTNIFPKNLAVVGDSRKQVRLFLSKGIGATNSIVNSKKESVLVGAINYIDAVREATVVKIDVEGAEYDYAIIQPQLRAIILEFHPRSDDKDWLKANEIMAQLRSNGFRPTYKIPRFLNGWDTNSAWVKGNGSKK